MLIFSLRKSQSLGGEEVELWGRAEMVSASCVGTTIERLGFPIESWGKFVVGKNVSQG